MHLSFAAVLIVPQDKSMVIFFHQTSICLIESHTHGLQGRINATSSSGNNGCARLEKWITRFKNGSFKAAKGLLDFRSKNSRIMIIEYLSKLMIKLFCMLLPKLYLKLISQTE